MVELSLPKAIQPSLTVQLLKTHRPLLRMDGWIDGCMYDWMFGNGCIDGCMDGWMDGRMFGNFHLKEK